MPRRARLVAPGVAHHVTQRGTGRQTVFFTRNDRLVYLRLLKENSVRAGLTVLAYCLMPNHIHLIAVPAEEDSLAVALRRTHGRYAQYLNARKVRSGHLWQNRFYSCPLEERHLCTALRYVERNPVRAGLVGCARECEWSSAEAHWSGKDTRHVLDMRFWAECGGRESWAALLGAKDEESEVRELRRATYAGKPLGSQEFEEEMRRRKEQREAARRGAGLGFGEAGIGLDRVHLAGA